MWQGIMTMGSCSLETQRWMLQILGVSGLGKPSQDFSQEPAPFAKHFTALQPASPAGGSLLAEEWGTQFSNNFF